VETGYRCLKVRSYKRDNEHSGSIKETEFLDRLSKYQLFKEEPTSLRYLSDSLTVLYLCYVTTPDYSKTYHNVENRCHVCTRPL
jgi:hypothetical protein